jgi:multidrug resistance efflux pump
VSAAPVEAPAAGLPFQLNREQFDQFIANFDATDEREREEAQRWVDQFVMDAVTGKKVDQCQLHDVLRAARLSNEQFAEMARNMARRLELIELVSHKSELQEAAAAAMGELSACIGRHHDELEQLKAQQQSEESEIRNRQLAASDAERHCREAEIELRKTSRHAAEYARVFEQLQSEGMKLDELARDRRGAESRVEHWKRAVERSNGNASEEYTLRIEQIQLNTLNSKFEEQQTIVEPLAARLAQLTELVMKP